MSDLSPAQRWNNRTLTWLMVPIIIEQLLSVTIGAVDTMMVAVVSESAVSGVSLVDSINLLFFTVFNALANGGAVVVSQYLGRQDRQNASLAARQLVYITVLVATGVTVLLEVFRGPLLPLVFGALEPEVLSNAQLYCAISALSFPFIALYSACASIFRSMGNSRIAMWIMLVTNVVHLGGNFLLIFGLGMGAAGAATSTLVSRAFAAIVLLVLLVRAKGGEISLQGLVRVRFVPDMAKRILRIGAPNGLENSLFHVGKLMVARLVASFGTAAIAGNAMANTITNYANMPGHAFMLGIIIVVGHCVGAGDYEAARRNTAKLMKVSILIMLGICAVIVLAMGPLLGALGLSDEATSSATAMLWVFCLGAPLLWSPSFILPSALRGAGDVRYNMVIALFSMWVFRVGGAFLLAHAFGLGALGVWVAMVVDWAVRSLFYIVRWRSGKWERQKVIQ